MNAAVAVGLSVMFLAGLYLVDITRRGGERYEYAYAMFVGELGLMYVVGEIVPSGTFGAVVLGAFAVSAAITFFVWLRLFRQWQRSQREGSTKI